MSKDKALNQSDIWLHTCSWWTKCTETTGQCSISTQPWSINSTFQIAMSNGSKQQLQKNCRIGWYVVFQPPSSNVIHLKSQFNGLVEINNHYAIVIVFLESCFFSWLFSLFKGRLSWCLLIYPRMPWRPYVMSARCWWGFSAGFGWKTSFRPSFWGVGGPYFQGLWLLVLGRVESNG